MDTAMGAGVMRLMLAILLMLSLTATARTQMEVMHDVWARRGAAKATYFPPGWSQSLIYLKFNTADGTNILDYSAVGTNRFYVVSNLAANAISISNGCFSITTNGWAQSVATGIGSGKTNCTIAAWYNVSTFRSWGGIFEGRIGSGGKMSGVLLGDTTARAVAGSYNDIGNPTLAPLASVTNVWLHVAFVYTNSATLNAPSFSVYTNGVLATNATVEGSSTAPMGSYTWYVGTDPYIILQRNFRGSIDDCYFTTYPLTSDEVRQLYQQGRSP